MDFLKDLDRTVANALAEDIGDGDVTAGLVETDKQATAHVITRQAATICGRPWVDEVFRQVDADVDVTWHVDEGSEVAADTRLLTAIGSARSILTAERTALNFLQLLSGTATKAAQIVELVKDTGVTILDTRKTIPGLRLAQKYAVAQGGAANHRIGLYDAFLIKENHIEAAGSITGAIALARNTKPGYRVEVEVESKTELLEAIASEPDWIMLDNFSLDDMREACEIVKGTGIKLEASGGIETSEEMVNIARTGVDFISIGALTKHNEAIDLSMRFE